MLTRPLVDFHLVSLTVFLLYLNFMPQRIELALTDKLDQFPFPYVWLFAIISILLV